MNIFTRVAMATYLLVSTISFALAGSAPNGSSSVRADVGATAEQYLFIGDELVNPGKPTAGLMTVMPGSVPTVTSVREPNDVPETYGLPLRRAVMDKLGGTITTPLIKTWIHDSDGYIFKITPYQADLGQPPEISQYLALANSSASNTNDSDGHPFAAFFRTRTPNVQTPVSRVVLDTARFTDVDRLQNYKLGVGIEVKCENEDETDQSQQKCNADTLLGSIQNMINIWFSADFSSIPGHCIGIRGTVGDKWEGSTGGFGASLARIFSGATGGVGPSYTSGSGKTVPTLGALGVTCYVLMPNSQGVQYGLNLYNTPPATPTRATSGPVYIPTDQAGQAPITYQGKATAVEVRIYTPNTVTQQ